MNLQKRKNNFIALFFIWLFMYPVYAEEFSDGNYLSVANNSTDSITLNTETNKDGDSRFKYNDLYFIAGISATSSLISSLFPAISGVFCLAISGYSLYPGYFHSDNPAKKIDYAISTVMFLGLGGYYLSVDNSDYDQEQLFYDGLLIWTSVLSLLYIAQPIINKFDNRNKQNSFYITPLPQGGTAIGLNYQF